MYRCTDCGQEYKMKPDYCDCGNDLFEEIVENIQPQPVYNTSAPSPQTVRKSLDLPSLMIFLTCIVLSILSWVFIGREPVATEQPKSKPTPQKVVEIPSIDKLWKDSALPQKTIEVKAVDVQPVPVPTKTITRKITPKPVQPKSDITPQQVVKQEPQTPETPTPSMTEQQKQEIIKKLTTTKTQLPAKKVEESKPAQIEKKPEPPKVDLAAQKRELNAYKTALRNKLGGHINFAAVIGDGKCAITFKLDSSGNLINRAFSIQSSNDSLNDAVYAAMMQNPTFKAPPEGYKNETLTLTVQIYGGQFEVGLR